MAKRLHFDIDHAPAGSPDDGNAVAEVRAVPVKLGAQQRVGGEGGRTRHPSAHSRSTYHV